MLCVLGAVVTASKPARAHWCDDLWGSGYNISVHPATDTVSVPSGGSGTLELWVQNNMGYPLLNFALSVEATGCTINVQRQTTAKQGFLLPGESAKYTVTITKSGGGNVAVTDLSFFVSFGENSGQSGQYGRSDYGRDVVIRQTSGSVFPKPAPNLGTSNSQAVSLRDSAYTDYSGDTNGGLDRLMLDYCAGRGSWTHTGSDNIGSNQYCKDSSSSSCPAAFTDANNGSKFDYPKLWAAGELAARKSALGARLSVLRERLKCGVADANLGFSGFALVVLGYLGEDSSARTFIQGKINAGGDLGTIAKAALLLMGSAADMTKYESDVRAGLKSTNTFVADACAAALGIAANDDTVVEGVLFAHVDWKEPDTGENGRGFYASHLLELVAWDRRGWAANAADTGSISFYPGGGGVVQPTGPVPKPPGNVKCTAQSSGDINVSWDAVTTDTASKPATITSYKVYYGPDARPSAATRPGTGGFDYAHVETSNSTSAALSYVGGKEYIAVSAVNDAGTASDYSAEISCTSSKQPPPEGTGGSTSGGGGGAGMPQGGDTSGDSGGAGTGCSCTLIGADRGLGLGLGLLSAGFIGLAIGRRRRR